MQWRVPKKEKTRIGERRSQVHFAWLPVDCKDPDGSVYKVWWEHFTVVYEFQKAPESLFKSWEPIEYQRHVEFEKT